MPANHSARSKRGIQTDDSGARGSARAGLWTKIVPSLLLAFGLAPGLATAIAVASCGDSAPPVARPNVLLVTLDTVRFDHIGCYGHAEARTPNIDALAARGVRFERAYAHTPYTLPSHATMLTGVYPNAHGVHVNFQGVVHPDAPSLTEALHASGYRTGAFVATGVLDRRFGLARGFDAYDDLSDRPLDASQQVERPGDEVTRNALKWLAQVPERPFFAWVHYYDAHDPHTPPEGYRDLANPYDGEIAFVDAQLGRLLQELERSNRLANTIVVVTADHGEAFGEHGEEGHGVFVYDATMHVPMVIAGPAPIRAGTTVSSPAGLVDLHPTLLQLVGAQASSEVEGTSLVPALRGEVPVEHALQLESEYPLRAYGWAPLHGLIEQQWKYIRAPEEELYDLVSDPLEQRNEVAAQPKLHAAMAAQLARLRETGPRRNAGDVHLGLDARNALSKLGYVEGADGNGGDSLDGLADPKSMTQVVAGAVRARALLRIHESAAALAIVAPLVEVSPQSGHLWMILGSAQLAQNRPQDAVKSFEKSLESFPKSTERLRFLGDALAASGRGDEAFARYREALAIDPQDGTSAGRIGGFLARAGRIDEAFPHFQRFVELEPNSANAHTNFANALFAKGRFPEGIAQLEHALRLDPQCAPAYRDMYTVEKQVNGRARAVAALRAAVAALPGDPFFRSRLAWELATARDASAASAKEAVELAQQCVHGAPQDPVLLDVLGVALARRGDFAGAIQSANTALQNVGAQRATSPTGGPSTPGNAALSGAIQQRLGLYAQGQPYTE